MRRNISTLSIDYQNELCAPPYFSFKTNMSSPDLILIGFGEVYAPAAPDKIIILLCYCVTQHIG